MFDFSEVVDRHGTWCTQWGYVADHFDSADLLPFTTSDVDFVTAPYILEVLTQRLSHGVLGHSRWKNDEFLAVISHWFLTRHNTQIDPQSLVYDPSVIYMVSELIRQWSSAGDAVVVHTPAYDAFYKAIEGNQRQVYAVGFEGRADGWVYDMVAPEKALSRPESKTLLLCSPHDPAGKVWTCDELEIMAELCQHHGVKVTSDEIHMNMVWAGQPHIPWSNVARDSWALFTSGSKSSNIPALAGAYGIIKDEQSRNDYLSALKDRNGLPSPAVLALSAHIAAYQQGASWLDVLRDYLVSNLHYIAHELNNAFPKLDWQVPQFTYLVWIDLHPLNLDDHALQEVLIHQQEVTIMPGYTYGGEGRGFVRLNAGYPRSKLKKGVQGLINAIRTIR